MKLKLATWNINSVRLRINLVEKLLAEQYLVYDDEAKLVQTTKEALADLDKLFEADDEPEARQARERDADKPLTEEK